MTLYAGLGRRGNVPAEDEVGAALVRVMAGRAAELTLELRVRPFHFGFRRGPRHTVLRERMSGRPVIR